MSDEQAGRRKPGPKPKREATMTGAERTRMYRERKRARQVADLGLPTQAEWDRAKHIAAVVEDVLGRIYERLKILEIGIDHDNMETVRNAHWDLKHLAYEIAVAAGVEHAISSMYRRPGLKIWFDRRTKLPAFGEECPAGTDTSQLKSAIL